MELPLFPLHVVLFPGRPLPLHVFESRYREMLRDCLTGDRRFGVVAIRSGGEVGETPDVFDVGTIAEIESVTTLQDGRSELVARGVQRFRVLERLGGASYMRARVQPIDDGGATCGDRECAERLRELLLPYLKGLGAPDELLACVPQSPDRLAYLAAAAVQCDLREHQRLLELAGTAERLAATLELLRRETGLMRHLGAVGLLRPPGPGGADLN
jgi:Lon protease-like protein